ncbi:MAG: hypothetical protein PHS37_09955 [Candidatus Omnitrophica bacterium]|nr:hypothetical protein [Candidatus Omnitrophota bacterium]
MIEKVLQITKGNFWLLIGASMFGAAAILFLPHYFVFFLVFIPFVVFTAVFHLEKTAVILAVFLLFQDMLVYRFSGLPNVAMVIKRFYEGVVLLMFFVTVLRNLYNKRIWKTSTVDVPLFFLILLAILSSIKNRFVPHLYAAFDLFILLKGFMVFYVFYNLGLTRDMVYKISKVLGVITLIIFLLGMVDLCIPQAFRNFVSHSTYVDYRFGIPSVQSIFVHPAVFGWYMAFATCFCIAFLIILKKKRAIIFASLFMLGVILSMKFKPIAGLLVVFLLAIIFIPRNKRMVYVGIVGLLLTLFVVSTGNKITLLFKQQIHAYTQSPEVSSLARNVLYETSFRIAHDCFPLGSGLGTFGGWISALYYSPLYARYGIDNIYGLQKDAKYSFIMDTFWPYVIGQCGFLGLILYAAILAVFLIGMIRIIRQTRDVFIRAFTLASIMILIEALVESFAEPIFLKPPQFYFIFACLGITFSFRSTAKEEADIREDTVNK